MVSEKFWVKKKVLITGHTGFKGSWLSTWLQHMGACVVGYSLDVPTQPSLYELANVADGMISMYGDVRDRDHLSKTIAKYKPEIVIHMAAQSLVRRSYQNPEELASHLMKFSGGTGSGKRRSGSSSSNG